MKILILIFTFVFLVTGVLVLIIDANQGDSTHWIFVIENYQSFVFGAHMAGWMLLGMMANYYWDLLNAGKTIGDTNFNELLLPILVSPIVFYVVWSLWGGGTDKAVIAFSWNLVAFQNGFFWQVVLSKAAPFKVGEANNKSIKKD